MPRYGYDNDRTALLFVDKKLNDPGNKMQIGSRANRVPRDSTRLALKKKYGCIWVFGGKKDADAFRDAFTEPFPKGLNGKVEVTMLCKYFRARE